MVPPNQAKSPSPSVFSIATSDSSSGLWMAWQAKPQWERQSGREVEVKQISKTTWQVGGSLKKRRLLQLKPSWSVQMCENFRFFRLPKLILTIPCSKCWLSYTDTIRYLSISFPPADSHHSSTRKLLQVDFAFEASSNHPSPERSRCQGKESQGDSQERPPGGSDPFYAPDVVQAVAVFDSYVCSSIVFIFCKVKASSTFASPRCVGCFVTNSDHKWMFTYWLPSPAWGERRRWHCIAFMCSRPTRPSTNRQQPESSDESSDPLGRDISHWLTWQNAGRPPKWSHRLASWLRKSNVAAVADWCWACFTDHSLTWPKPSCSCLFLNFRWKHET